MNKFSSMYNKFQLAINNYFEIGKRNSTIRTEIVGGLTTFFAMAYILVVNPSTIMGSPNVDVGFDTLYIATCLGAIVGTLFMALYAKLPFGLAPGMGINAFFAFTVIGTVLSSGAKMTYANALLVVLISGIVFLIITLVGLREMIVKAIPTSIKFSIAAGIGVFIAFLGLQNAKIVVNDNATLVGLGALNFLKTPVFFVLPLITVFVTFIIIAVLTKHKVKGAILWGMLIGTIIHYIVGYAGGFVDPNNAADISKVSAYLGVEDSAVIDTLMNGGYSHIVMPSFDISNPIEAFKNWGQQGAGQVFVSGWKGLFTANTWFKDLMLLISVVLSFAMVDMFDTIGTLLGTAQRANLLDKNGNMVGMNKALLADSVATCCGAIFGTSTVTTFVESTSGINAGARTGLASVVTGICFILCLFLTPLAQIIPTTATAAALIFVGVLMIGNITKIDFHDITVAVPAFLTIIMMAFTYNVSYGIGIAMISFVLMKLFSAGAYSISGVCSKAFASIKNASGKGKGGDDSVDTELVQSTVVEDTVAQETKNSDIVENVPAAETTLDEAVGNMAEKQDENDEGKEENVSKFRKALNELKDIHPITGGIALLFLIFFFFAH